MTTRRRQCMLLFCLPAIMLVATLGWVDQASSFNHHDCNAFCNAQSSKCANQGRQDCRATVWDPCVADCSRCCRSDPCSCRPPDRVSPRQDQTPPPEEEAPPPRRTKPYVNRLEQLRRLRACYDEVTAKYKFCRSEQLSPRYVPPRDCDRGLKIDTEKCKKKHGHY
jgi:hypothetical protein